MNRDQLAADADAYATGLRDGLTEGRWEGIAMERARIRKVEWAKLFALVVVASTIGCGIVLAVGIGLSNL